ncbi:MAG: hypothetical protein RLZZ272_564 [Actinomycetota bacterium]
MEQRTHSGAVTVEADVAPTRSPSALPVAIVCAPVLDDALRRWVEGILGWQPVEDDIDGPVPPRVRLADPAGHAAILAEARGSGRGSEVPTVLVVPESADATEVARLVARAVPAAVLAWPRDRDVLPELVASVVVASRGRRRGARTLRVGGAAGGVGATTVTLALAGLAGWARLRTLAIVRGHVPVRGTPRVSAAAIASPDLWSRALELPGVAGARVVAVDGGPAEAPVGRGFDLAVLDAGREPDVDVLVCRPDAAALDAVATTSAGAIVVVGRGLVAGERLAGLAGGRRVVEVADSVRVARAHLEGRVPTALPGRWLRGLVPLVDGVLTTEDRSGP